VCAHQRPIGGVGVDGESSGDRRRRRGQYYSHGGSDSGEDAAQLSNVGLGEASRGLGELVGGSAGCSKAQASELHGGDAMADGGREKSARVLWWLLL
jgi:hypothetical protein